MVYGHFHIISGVCLYLSSAINPILYNLMSTRFREMFSHITCCYCYSNRWMKRSSLHMTQRSTIREKLPMWNWLKLFCQGQGDPKNITYRRVTCWMNGLMRLKIVWIISHGLHSYQISLQLNTYGRFWTSHHHHRHTKWERRAFERIMIIPPSELRDLKNQYQRAGKLFWPNASSRHFLYVHLYI